MPTGKIRYFWDSCVFISLLTADRSEEDMANLRKLERLVDDGQVHIFTPATTLIEVLQCHLTDEQEAAFKGLLRRSNVQPVSVNMRVAEIAREIRSHYRGLKEMEIAVPDSINLAAAILYRANALHTYDGCGKRQRKADLLKLETPLIGKYHLKICKPEPPPAEVGDADAESPAPTESMNLF